MAKKSSAKSTGKPAAVVAPSNLIEPGKAAPDFTLPDQSGTRHRLKDYRERWVVLYFYPRDNTSGCTKQACQFRDAAADFDALDAVVFGVSPDDEASHDRFAAKFNLPFPLLADPEKKILARYGVWQEKSMYGRKYMGVVRTTYLIDPNGKVAHRWDKVKVPGHEKAVAKMIRELSV